MVTPTRKKSKMLSSTLAASGSRGKQLISGRKDVAMANFSTECYTPREQHKTRLSAGTCYVNRVILARPPGGIADTWWAFSLRAHRKTTPYCSLHTLGTGFSYMVYLQCSSSALSTTFGNDQLLVVNAQLDTTTTSRAASTRTMTTATNRADESTAFRPSETLPGGHTTVPGEGEEGHLLDILKMLAYFA